MRPVLKAEMARSGITTQEVAKCIGKTVGTTSLKINGKSDFFYSECEKIRDTFFPEWNIDTLFSTKQ